MKSYALLLTLWSGTALALDLAGLTIGAELSGADRAEFSKGDVIACNEFDCRGPRAIGDFTAQVFVEVDERQIIQFIRVTVPANNSEELLRAAAAKFGKPALAKAGTAQNLFGAQYSAAKAIWTTPAGSVAFFERCGKLTDSCVLALAKGYQTRAARREMKL